MSEEKTLLVNELYPCLQGEGFNLGKPSVLLRLQVCNLRCTWCDTPYTHTLKSDPAENDARQQRFKRMSVEQVAEEIKKHASVLHVIISGGEPTLQNFLPLTSALGVKYSFEVESNGTQIPHLKFKDFGEDAYEKFQWNISPKGKAAAQDLVPEALEHWAKLARELPRVFFKFVVRENERSADLEEILSLIEKYNIPSGRVYLMSEGTTQDSQLNNTWLHDICFQHGFSYTPRLHVLLFGNKRGV